MFELRGKLMEQTLTKSARNPNALRLLGEQ